MVPVSIVLVDGFPYLLGYLPHAFYRGVAAFLVYSLQLNVAHAVMVADGFGAAHYLLAKAVVDEKIDFHIGVALQHLAKQEGQGRAIREEVVLAEFLIFVLAHRGTSPTIVGSSEHEDDVGVAQLVHSLDERKPWFSSFVGWCQCGYRHG